MTPFDGAALVAMLLAFYPVVSPAHFRQARAERPEYFAGGVIIGSKGDKLQLPDGRVFDCIYAAGGLPADMRWQCIPAGDGGEDDPWPLEPGPLTPIDVPDDPAFTPGTVFQQIMAGALEQLGGSDATLGHAATRVMEMTPVDVVEAEYSDSVGRAEAHLDQDLALVGSSDLSDEIGHAGEIEGAITTTEEEHNEAPADQEYPSDTDPGPPGPYQPRPEPPGRENP